MNITEQQLRIIVSQRLLTEAITSDAKPYAKSLKFKGYDVEGDVRLLKLLQGGKGGGLFYVEKAFQPSGSTSFKLLTKDQYEDNKNYYTIDYKAGFVNSEERFLKALEDNKIVRGPLSQVDINEKSGVQEEIEEWQDDYFINFINNWKLFEKNYPNAALIWQLLDPAGTTGYADLAVYLEVYNKKSKTYFYDDFLLFLYILGASPIGLVTGLFSGRLAVQAANFFKEAAKAGKVASSGGLNVVVKSIGEGILKASDKFSDALGSAQAIQNFITRGASSVGSSIPADVALRAGQRIMRFAEMIDSVPARVFLKLFMPVFSNASSELQTNIIEALSSIDSTSQLLRSIEGFIRGDQSVKDVAKSMKRVYDDAGELFDQAVTTKEKKVQESIVIDINDDFLRSRISDLLLEEKVEPDASVDKAKEETNQEALDAIKVSDTSDSSQTNILSVKDGKITASVINGGKEREISPASREFHDHIGTIVNQVFDKGDEKNIALVKQYLTKMYPDKVKQRDGIRGIFRDYLKLM